MGPYASHTDDALLSLLSTNDEGAFTEIYHRYWKRLYAMAYDRLKDKSLAEDVVHEVFTSLWQRRQEALIRSLYPYLAAATKFCILKQYAGFSTTSLPNEDSMAHLNHAETPAIETRFLERMLQEEVSRLPLKCRIVFQYSRQENLTNKEIALELGISDKAVEKHITRALRQLRLSLKSLHQFFSVF